MEFLRIGESKIKIVMTADESEKYGISPKPDGSAMGSHTAVWQILDRAKSECGFDPRGEKVLVQFYPLKSGCEMFVTKLGILSSDSARAVSRSERVTLLSRAERHYLFSSRDSLVRAAREIYARLGEYPRSSLYADESRYVLSLEEHTVGDSGQLGFIREFATRISQDMGVYVTEHFDTIYADNALASIIENEKNGDTPT